MFPPNTSTLSNPPKIPCCTSDLNPRRIKRHLSELSELGAGSDMNPQKTEPSCRGTSEGNSPVEKLIEDGICSAGKVGWNVIKWVAPKAGRIFTKVALRGGKAAASTPAAKLIAEGAGKLARGPGKVAAELARGSSEVAVELARGSWNAAERLVQMIVFGIVAIVLLIGGSVVWSFLSTRPAPTSDLNSDFASTSSVTPTAPPAIVFEPLAAITTPKPEAASRFSTELEAQKAAVLLYPELGVAGSVFNKAFVAEVHRRKQTNPEFFRSTDWPIQLANEMAPGQKPASSGAFDH